tara:strand:+ start:7215 stop:7892 length:678 start_codon:yes stop_codon:yes gene_type:complete
MKKTNKKKVKKIKKVSKKTKKVKVKKTKKEEEKVKTPSLTASKSNEPKIIIKKIKKQTTEKKLFAVKDFVVYSKHGVGQILAVSKKIIGDIDVMCYDIKFEKENAIGNLPINMQSLLRPVSTINQINKSISILKSKPKIKRTMWSRRAQEYEQKINSGKIYELAEVVRDLNKDTDVIADQSYSERQLFEKAYERLLSEFEVVLGIGLENTQKKLDKALKRNQNIT